MGNRVCCPNIFADADQLYEVLVKDQERYVNHNCSFNPDALQPTYNPSTYWSQMSVAPSSSCPPDGGIPDLISTQHISEREPEDADIDPSWNSSRQALFVLSEVRHHGHASFPASHQLIYPRLQTACRKTNSSSINLRKWSSCGTIFIGDGCLISPHTETTLWGVAIAVELLVKASYSSSSGLVPPDPTKIIHSSRDSDLLSSTYKLFDERLFPIGPYPNLKDSTSSSGSKRNVPNQPPQACDVHEFLRNLFTTAFIAPQCAILALVLLERMINGGELSLFPWSWRRQLLACILIASKVLDDQAVWNTDYCQILREVSVDDLNSLERHTLSILQFNIDVSPAVYARYYFDLLQAVASRGIANRPSARRRLTPQMARDLRIIPTPSELSSGKDSMLCDVPRYHHECLIRVKKSSETSTKQPSTKPDDPKSNSGQLITVNQSSHRKCSIESKPVTLSSHDSAILNEGPLILDDETELINSLTSAEWTTRRMCHDLPTAYNPSSLNTHSPHYRKFFSTVHNGNFNRNSDQFAYAHLQSEFNPSSSVDAPEGKKKPSDPSASRPGFIRSIMGGEVAYSLLRDAGVY